MLKRPDQEVWSKIDHTINSLPDLWRAANSGMSRALKNNEIAGHSLAREILRLRRARELDAPDLFHDPAWDILLDLFAASAEGKAVSVSSACIAAAAPPTTALRYINHLQREGYLMRYRRGADKRIIFVSLTLKGMTVVERFLEGLSAVFGCELKREATEARGFAPPPDATIVGR